MNLSDFLKIILGSALSIVTAFILLKVESGKQVQFRRHEFAIKDLGEKLFSPLLNQLAQYETKKALGRTFSLDLGFIIDAIDKNGFQLLFTTEKINSIIREIYETATTTTSTTKSNIKTQDEIIISCIQELRMELKSMYSKYRM